MRHGLYAHPWDLSALDEVGGLARVAGLGFRDVSMAVTDHGGRMLRAWSDRGVVQDLEGGVVHFRTRGDYGRLRPLPSTTVQVDQPSPLERLVDGCRAAGLEAWAWARPLRNPRLGDRFPATCVVNAFGDHYRTVLCPAQPEVQDYVLQLVDDLAAHRGLAGIELEAIGFGDHRRGGARIAESLPPDPYVDFLLSACFCPDCTDSLGRTGLDGGRLREQVRELVRRRLATADLLAPQGRPATHEEVFRQLESDLGKAGMFALWSHRLSVYMRLLNRIRSTVARRCRIALHVNFHSLFAGDAIGAPLQVVQSHADELVVSHLHETPDQVRQAWRGEPARKVAIRATIQPKPPAFRSIEDLFAVRDAIAAGGGEGLKVHHLGLLPWPTIERVAAALREPVAAGRTAAPR